MSETTVMPQAPPARTDEQVLLDRQTGIKSWEKMTREPEKREEAPKSVEQGGESSDTYAPDALKSSTQDERKTWRETGELPKAKPRKEASTEPETAKDASSDAEDVGIGPTDPQTPDEIATYKVQHERKYSDFIRSIHKVDPDLKTDMMNINLDTQRGALVMHSLADCSLGQRKHVAKMLANRPDIQLLMVQRDARGNYVYRPDEVAGVVRIWAREYRPAAKEKPTYVTRAPKPVSEVGGRETTPTDPLVSETRAHPGKLTRSAKAEMDRQFASRHRDRGF
jgi:hypothetical protein